MSRHDDLQVLVYKNDYWENNLINKAIKNTYTLNHELEVPIIKGEGSFKKIIGYVDYIIENRLHTCPNYSIKKTYGECVNRTDICRKAYICYKINDYKIGIELKTTKESLGETLRQITMYRTFMKFDRFYLIGDCMLEYRDILKDHKIYMIEEKEFKNENGNKT